MKLLLLYLLGVLVVSARGYHRGTPARVWSLVVVALAVSAAFYTRRVL